MGNFQLAPIVINILQIRESQAQKRNHLFMGPLHVRRQIMAVPWAIPDGAGQLLWDLLELLSSTLTYSAHELDGL